MMKNNKKIVSKKGKPNTSFKAVSKSAKGKHRTQNQAGAKKHFARKSTSTTALEKQNPRKKGQRQSNDMTNEPKTESYGVRHLTIDAKFEGQRIDNYLRRLMPNLPKSRLYQMLRKGEVRLNKKRVKADSRVKVGDELRLPPITIQSKEGVFVPNSAIESIRQTILYKDEHFLILNKPSGIAVHSGSKNQYGVIDAIRQAFPEAGWELCHRLDKDTSGCLVLANSRNALNEFQHLSMAGDIHKQYLTLVKGSWVANELLITTPIEKRTISRMNEQGEFEQIVEGGDIETHSIFTTRENYAKTTLMQVVIKTGKTHQIRVHASLNKHPVAMDDKYGDFKWNRALENLGLPRMFLHAHMIRFRAFGETIHISADLPNDLQNFLTNHC